MANPDNSLSLPSEILLKIFKDAASDVDVDESAKTLFLLARVCPLWRGIILAYGSTWSTLSFATANITELMLERSKTAPLTLRIDLGSKKRWVGLDAAVARDALGRALGRVKELVVVDGGDLNPNRNILQTLANGPVASLTSLELVSPKTGDNPAFRIAPTYLTGAVHLRRLTLHDTELLNGVGNSLPGLCSHISHLNLRDVRGLSLSALLGILAAGQRTLRTLELSSLQLSDGPQVTLSGEIHLRALEEISLLGIETPVATSSYAVIPYIKHSPAVRFTTHVHASAGTLHALQPQSPLCIHLASLGYDFRSALLGPVGRGQFEGLRLRCWASTTVPDIHNLDQRPPAPLDLRVTNSIGLPRRAVASLLATMAKAANISTVWRAAVPSSVDRQAWARVLFEASSLYEVSVYGSDNLRNLFIACTLKANGLVGDHDLYVHAEISPLPVLARLKTLNVYGLDLSDSTVHYGDKHALIGILKSMTHKGAFGNLEYRLEELCICYSNMHNVDRLDIAPFVNHGQIIWDGAEQGKEKLPDEEASSMAVVEVLVPSAPAPPAPVAPQINVQQMENDWMDGLPVDDFGIDDADILPGNDEMGFIVGEDAVEGELF